jgi:hypothetical protein
MPGISHQMSSATPISDGTYYISSQISLTYITLDGATEGTNVTAWTFDGNPHQQVFVFRSPFNLF